MTCPTCGAIRAPVIGPGSVVGRWTVLRPATRDAKLRKTWMCQCACGRLAVVNDYALARGTSTGCRFNACRCSGQMLMPHPAEIA